MDKSISDIDRLFIEGDRSLHQGKYNAAIDIFEQLLEVIETDHNQYFNIQRNLVKAYQQNEQQEKAIALCQLMIDSNSSVATLWGSKFMTNLIPEFEAETSSESITQETTEISSNISASRIKLKTLSEFKQYCQIHLLDNLRAVEKKRINALASMFVAGVIGLVFNWAFIRLTLHSLGIQQSDISFLYVLGLFLLIPLWIIFCRGCIQVYKIGFKRNIIEKIIDFIDDGESLKYASNLFLEDKRQTILGFTRSQIFRNELHEPDNLEQEDCVYGSIGETDIFFAEIWVENIRSSYLNEFEIKESAGKSLIFHGLFFEAKFAKNFISRTFVMPNTLKSKVLASSSWRGEEVKLEDIEFNHIFKVYSDNQVEARYLLSTNLMSRLVDFSHKAKHKVHLSFIDGFMYIAIPYRYRLFEPKLFQSMKSFAPLKEYFFDLQLMIEIVNDLNLNRRIWKKQKL